MLGLDGGVRIPRRRFRCRTCGRDLYAGDGLLLCGRHRVTRPLAQRVCQLATVDGWHSTPLTLFVELCLRQHFLESFRLLSGGFVDRGWAGGTFVFSAGIVSAFLAGTLVFVEE